LILRDEEKSAGATKGRNCLHNPKVVGSIPTVATNSGYPAETRFQKIQKELREEIDQAKRQADELKATLMSDR